MKKVTPLVDLAKANAKLRAWRKKYNAPEKVAAQHRKRILGRVVESMAFEGEPVSQSRLKALLKKEKESRLPPSAKK